MSESVLTVNGFFLLWRMKHERGMSEVMHLELIVKVLAALVDYRYTTLP